jgi:two-component system chemotaxis sensor kinase CheA
MSGFNLAELLPYYLDETDEHIAGLNDALLRLEQDPADAKALQDAFRMFHSIKGASVVMGFQAVNRLTHHMESLFEQLRSKKRTLDRPVLDLTFRCLDELRDYHRDLRAHGQSEVDLSALTAEVDAAAHATPAPAPAPAVRSTAPIVPAPASAPAAEAPPAPARPTTAAVYEEPGRVVVTIVFEAGLPLADMKARLVLNRLSSRGRVLSTDPPAEKLDEVESLARFTIVLAADCDADELRALADVEGVAEVRVRAADRAEADRPAPAAPAIPPVHAAPTPPTSIEPAPAGPDPVGTTVVVPPGAVAAEAAEAAAESAPTAEAPAAPGGRKKPRVAETIRVESDRLDHLMNLAGELVITKARFVAITRGLEELFRGPSAQADHGRIREAREQVKALSEAIHSLGRVSDGLQKGVLDTRMVPIGPLFERFRRVIRDLSVASGKEVNLQIGGEKTELDKRMIDELSDPLIHMVRNAVDHGLEPPAVREAAGKPRAGTVTLQASHRGNSVVITVGDDGRGIDCERVRRKVVSKGLLSEAEARELSDRDLVAYIWHPGLSTAETITEISGRGVGMDIVKSRIENLSGAVDVRSVLGQGTTFTIRLPLTLAIMSSLLVRIYDEIYAIPLDHIDEIVEVRRGQIYRIQGRPAIEIRKKIVALSSLGDVFRWGGREHPASRNGTHATGDGRHGHGDAGEKRTVVIVQDGETTIGLLVDELIGMQEVVLKSLEKNFRSIPGLSGASILGDGRVSLILDLDAVIDMVARQSARRREATAERVEV